MDKLREISSLSVVTTLYKSERFVVEFNTRIVKTIRELGIDDYEIIYVNDGSPDNAGELARQRATNNPRIRYIELSRNFGHHNAILCGLEHAQKDYVYLVDCDLEVAPETLNDFYDVMIKNEYDAISGYQEHRKGKFVERIFGKIFWKMIAALSGIAIKENLVTERLMTMQYVKAICSLGDYSVFLGGMFHWVGFNHKVMPVKKDLRAAPSSYSFVKRFDLFFNAMLSFTDVPLRLVFVVGVFISSFAAAWLLYIVTAKVVFKQSFEQGWPSIAGVVLLSCGIVVSMNGMIALYIGKVFQQVKNRPRYIIQKEI